MRRALLLALALAACSRSPAPSPEYAEARRRHAEALSGHPGDAVVRPEIDEVLKLLGRVPPGSADAAAAAELRSRIEAERKALAEEGARRQAAVEKAAQPGTMPAAPAVPVPAAGARGAARAASAQEQDGLRFAAGTKLDDFRAAAGECFEKKADVAIVEGAKERPGEAWGLREGPACAAKHAPQVGQWILFADGALVASQPAAAATTRTVRREEARVETFEAVPLPGGGFGRRMPDGKVEPLPPGTVVQPAPQPAAPAAPGSAR